VLLVGVGLCSVASGEANPPGWIGLISPRPGEAWTAGSRHYVIWRTTQIPADRVLGLEYSADGGKTWIEIAPAVPNSGRFLWTVPATLSDTCRLAATDRTTGARATSKSDFTIAASQRADDYRWVNVTMKAAFAPRDGAGALTYNGKMWLIGGWNPSDKERFPTTCDNDVWCSEDGLTWTMVKPNTWGTPDFDLFGDWEGRHTAGYVVYKDKMWIVGGDANQRHYQYDVWNSADGKSWNHVNRGRKVTWGPRVLHYTLVFKDKIWVMGGQTLPQYGMANERFYDDVWNSTDGVNWRRVITRKPHWPARGMIGGSVVFKDQMWILGGGTYDTPRSPRRFYNDVWSSPDGVNWTQHVAFAPWEPRQYHDVAVFDDRMWVMEGWNQVNRNDVWYSSDGVNWYELPDTPWKPRHAASVFVHDGALWMVAGNNMESDVWKLRRTAPTTRQARAEATRDAEP
jgi:hypothetical protein